MAGKNSRQKKSGQGFQLPSHVQTSLNKEERLLQRNLNDLEKETRHKMRCIVQDQQVAGTKLRSLQSRLLASQKKFHALIHPPSPPTQEDLLKSLESQLPQENEDSKRSRRTSTYQENGSSRRTSIYQENGDSKRSRRMSIYQENGDGTSSRRTSMNGDGKRSRKGSIYQERQQQESWSGRKGGYLRSSLKSKRRASKPAIRKKNVVFTQM